jgi:integrase
MPKKSTKAATPGKPQKPRPDFPLFPHATGRWAKKVRGKLHYLGKVADDPKGERALTLWLEDRDDLLAGMTPRRKRSDDELTVSDLCNHFLIFKEQQKDTGELAPRTFARYKATSELLTKQFGRFRLVADLRTEDFQKLRSTMSKRWGPVAVGNEIQMVRSIFRYGYEAEHMDKPVRFGPGFKKPSAKTIRKTRTANGPRMFTAQQVRLLLAKATPNGKAMILLGINGGLGNTDLAMMPTTAPDLDGGWLDYAREKTAIHRRIPLWNETVTGMREALDNRAEPKSPDDVGLLFIGPRGQSYIGDHKGYRVTAEFDRIAKKAKVQGRTFYDLRRTFQTVGEGAADLAAVQAIMGHAAGTSDMSAVYRQTVSDDRLRAVTDHVHDWLFGASLTNIADQVTLS